MRHTNCIFLYCLEISILTNLYFFPRPICNYHRELLKMSPLFNSILLLIEFSFIACVLNFFFFFISSFLFFLPSSFGVPFPFFFLLFYIFSSIIPIPFPFWYILLPSLLYLYFSLFPFLSYFGISFFHPSSLFSI